MPDLVPRRATQADAPAISRIVNDWIDGTDWIPRVIDREAIDQAVADGLPQREAWVIGEPVEGYLTFNPETAHVVALYSTRPGAGLGKALMDQVKIGRDYLFLWTHEPNTRAQAFYRREGFEVVDRNPCGNDTLPELKMEWRR